jgi:RNA polymerase sigma factor (TIGR02999 family)
MEPDHTRSSGDPATDVSRMLGALGRGELDRADELLPLVYEELRALARANMAHEKPGQTLQATALVHEAWMRLVGDGAAERPAWNGRGHFFGAAARAMRRILVEQARRKARLKHGGARERVELGDVEPEVEGPGDDVLAIEEALRRLEREDARKGRIVELRYFAGLTVEETASVLCVSVGTVEREWRFVRAWLQVELDGEA